MRDEYLVACHLVDQSEEIYGHLSRGVRRGSGPSRRNLNFNESYSKLNECAVLIKVKLRENIFSMSGLEFPVRGFFSPGHWTGASSPISLIV